MKHSETSKWGKDTAKTRYAGVGGPGSGAPSGEPKKALIGLVNQPMVDETGREMQAPQAVNDHHGPGHDNDASGWVRGNAMHPNFDSTAKRLAGSKHRDTP